MPCPEQSTLFVFRQLLQSQGFHYTIGFGYQIISQPNPLTSTLDSHLWPPHHIRLCQRIKSTAAQTEERECPSHSSLSQERHVGSLPWFFLHSLLNSILSIWSELNRLRAKPSLLNPPGNPPSSLPNNYCLARVLPGSNRTALCFLQVFTQEQFGVIVPQSKSWV